MDVLSRCVQTRDVDTRLDMDLVQKTALTEC